MSERRERKRERSLEQKKDRGRGWNERKWGREKEREEREERRERYIYSESIRTEKRERNGG